MNFLAVFSDKIFTVNSIITLQLQLGCLLCSNLPIMLSGISFFFLAYYSQNYAHSSYYSPNYAHIFTHYNTITNHPSITVCNCFNRVGDCFIRVGDCSIRVYWSFSLFLCLHCFSDVSKFFLDFSARKSCNLLSIIPRNSRVFPNSFNHLVYWLWWASCHPQNQSMCERLWWWTLGPQLNIVASIASILTMHNLI